MATPDIAVGIDIGGSFFKVGLVTGEGQILRRRERPTPTGEGAEVVLAAVTAAVEALLLEVGLVAADAAGVGMGVPGRVDPASGIVIRCPNLHALDGRAICSELQDRLPGLSLPLLANDAQLATLAELRYGAGRGARNLLLLTLGTGVGGGVAFDGQVVRGPRQILGEVGHTVVSPHSERRCGCGSFGCLETLVAKRAIVESAALLLQSGAPSVLEERAAGGAEELTPEAIAEAAHAGDAVAREVYTRAGAWIGIALSSMIVLCDPDVIVLGGGIAAAGEVLLGPVRRTVRQRSRISGFDPARIVLAELGNDAGMIGAAAMVWDAIRASAGPVVAADRPAEPSHSSGAQENNAA